LFGRSETTERLDSSQTAFCPWRILSLYGHRHYNNVRFSAWRVRGSQKDLVLDDYDAVHPGVLEYNSLTKNQPQGWASAI
jgi:hypothetical protein